LTNCPLLVFDNVALATDLACFPTSALRTIPRRFMKERIGF